MTEVSVIRDAVNRHRDSAVELLRALVRFPSTSGREQDAMTYLEGALKTIPGLTVERVPLGDELAKDPDYSDPIPEIRYDGRFNLRVHHRGSRRRTLLLNTHVDVVPPSVGQTDPWGGELRDGVVWGRGACDAKGQVAAIWLTLRALAEMRAADTPDVVAHLVVEEENGGNGSLAQARRGEKADLCVVLEPTDGAVHPSIRGAVWFRLTFTGTAGHSGQAAHTRSALLHARDAMGVLEGYHAKLLSESRGLPLFDPFPNPMPLTFGRLEAGNWPASAPSRAVMEGVLGLLPNRTKEEVCQGIRDALDAHPTLAGAFDLHFMYRHDSSVVPADHELVRALAESARAAGRELRVTGMTASCDAWFYNNQLGIPTVVYGPGALKYAHSKDEQIAVDEVGRAAEILAGAALRTGGSRGT